MLFTRHQLGPDDPVIRVRLARSADRPAVESLLRAHTAPPQIKATRLLRHDPRTQLVLCATAWHGGRERVVGVASAPLEAGAPPDVLVSDEATAPGAAVALRRATRDRVG